MIHDTPAQLAKSPAICQREGGGEVWAWAMSKVDIRPVSINSIVCDLKGLVREDH